MAYQYDENGDIIKNPITDVPIEFDWPTKDDICYGWVNTDTGHCYGFHITNMALGYDFPGLVGYDWRMHAPQGYWYDYENKVWLHPDTYPQPENPGPAGTN